MLEDVGWRPWGNPMAVFSCLLGWGTIRKGVTQMTTITQDEITRGEEVVAALYGAIRALRQQIEGQTRQLQSGEQIDETATARSLRNLRGLVAECAKAENYLNECKSREAGIARGGYALDLERARAEIGCKLDRLRRCCDPGPVSE